jgi:hypothetical protein
MTRRQHMRRPSSLQPSVGPVAVACRHMGRAQHCRAIAAAVVLLCVCTCEYDLDVGHAWQIDHPRVIGVRMEVVEPAPIWPERLGYDIHEAAIAEALPGDLVELQALAVGGDGRVQAPGSLDALWFQCGVDRCRIDVPACDSLEWTTDVACELGRGGALELTFPALGPMGFEQGWMPVLGIIGRDPSVDAERCREAFLSSSSFSSMPSDSSEPVPDEPACTTVEAHVLIGPRWVLQFEAALAGFEPELPLEQIPHAVVYQPANRAPAPEPPTWFDADTKLPLEGSPPRVRPGQRITTSGPNWRFTDRQLYATVDQVDDTNSFVFSGDFERLGTIYLGSGPIRDFIADGNQLWLEVDAFPSTAIIRVVMIVGDRRGASSFLGSAPSVTPSTINMFATELEVEL